MHSVWRWYFLISSPGFFFELKEAHLAPLALLQELIFASLDCVHLLHFMRSKVVTVGVTPGRCIQATQARGCRPYQPLHEGVEVTGQTEIAL